MAGVKKRESNFIDHITEPHPEREHVRVSDLLAKTCRITEHLKKPENERQTYGSVSNKAFAISAHGL